MATCPNCGVKSREDPQAMEITLLGLMVRPDDMAFVPVDSEPAGRLTCLRCGWSIFGRLMPDEFLGDPDTQTFPTPTAMKESHERDRD